MSCVASAGKVMPEGLQPSAREWQIHLPQIGSSLSFPILADIKYSLFC